MPILPENRGRYPKDWKAISLRIRKERAGDRCEECGAQHGMPHPVTGSIVVLTVGHLDHTPENCADDNLKAWCQRCHLRYDQHHHARTRRSRRAAADLFDGAPT
jgi:hypothetical protein